MNNQTKNHLNKIDIKLITSTHFDAKKYQYINKKGESDYLYGTKKLIIANYIIGICKSNLRSNKPRTFTFNTIDYVLGNNQSIILYKHIQKLFHVSLEYIRQVVNELIQLQVLTHEKIDDHLLWVFALIDEAKQIFNFLFNCKQIIRTKKHQTVNIANDQEEEEPPPDNDHDKVNW